MVELNLSKTVLNRRAHIEDKNLQVQEKILLKIFSRSKKITIFDVGSCEGENSIRYSRIFKKSKIYSFEPLIENFEIIEENILIYGVTNIFPINTALGNQNGTITFYVSNANELKVSNDEWNFGNKSSSILEPHETLRVFPWLRFDHEIAVPVTSIDSFCLQRNISKIDFLHMDVQGAELIVLDGAREMLTRIDCIWLEVEKIQLYKNQPLKEDVEKFLSSNGFILALDAVGGISGDQFWINGNSFILT